MTATSARGSLPPRAPWLTLALALDSVKLHRGMCSRPTWHYCHKRSVALQAGVRRYRLTSPKPRWAKGHAIDLLAKSVRLGWMPMTPHFNRNPLDIVTEAEGAAGAKTDSKKSFGASSSSSRTRAAPSSQRSRSPGELAASVVHLARQRHLGERQGDGILLAPLPRDARQRHRRRSRQRQDAQGAIPRPGAARKV